MGVNLTHHDVNWTYNHQHLKGQGYYLKTRVPTVRLISCLPHTNKGMDKDLLIVLGEWHDGLHCPIWDGTPGGVFMFRFTTITIPFFSLTFFVLTFFVPICKLVLICLPMSYSNNVFTFDEFADKYFTIPNFSLINEPDLTKILKAEIFVHTDRQLRVTHFILGYNPISSSFQAPKYVIKANDPRL